MRFSLSLPLSCSVFTCYVNHLSAGQVSSAGEGGTGAKRLGAQDDSSLGYAGIRFIQKEVVP